MITQKTKKAYNTEVLKENIRNDLLAPEVEKAVYYELYNYLYSEVLLDRIASLLLRLAKVTQE